MDFVNKIVCSLATKHPDQRTVRKPLAKSCKRLLAVLHKFPICVVKDSLSPIVIPTSLISLLDFAILFSIIDVIFAIINV